MPGLNLKNYLSQTISKDNWERVGFKKRSGVLFPLFSAYSENSFGIGDLGDLKLIIDWAKSTGNSIIQLLPMNEVGPNFCPYDALSSFALEPSYICLKDFPGLSLKKFNLPAQSSHIDYAVKEEKIKLLWSFYLAQDLSEAFDFEEFQRKNSYWLSDFAIFKELKDYHHGRPWYEWDEKFKNRSIEALSRFKQDNIEKVTFWMWMQWILFKQFKEASVYASSKKIFIKGDLPVLVSRDSSDVWSHPEFFKLEFAAGAPPDMYAAFGQRWGMPTYNWQNIEKNDYRYIKEKLKYAEEFYNILRVDHVVGLFRIWSIPFNEPQENAGLNGVFDPVDEQLWYRQGQDILKILVKNTKMLFCAEDLGVVPKCCTDTLLEFGICGNDVQRWAKDWDKKHDFLLPEEYRQLAVAMLATHDTTNWRAWWKYEAGTVDKDMLLRKCNDRNIDFEKINNKLFDAGKSYNGRLRWKKEIDSPDKLLWELGRKEEEVRDFIDIYKNSYAEKEKLWKILNCRGKMDEEASPELLNKIFAFTLDSRAVFCINLINDYLSLGGMFKGDPYQYRVNLPGTVSPQNWSLRLPISLEEMLKHSLNKQIRKMITDSGRA